MHFPGIQIGGMPRLPVSGFLSGNEVGVGDLCTAEVGFLEIAFNPFRCRVSTPGFDEILADFGVPHVAEAVLRNAALLAPWLYLEAIALTIVKERLELLTNGGKITAVEFDAALRKVHASPPKRLNAEYRKPSASNDTGGKEACSDCSRI